MRIEDGGPAFPTPPNEAEQEQNGWEGCPKGMSLRDYFAAKAMQGIMSNPDHVNSTQYTSQGNEEVAKQAVMVADALLAALK